MTTSGRRIAARVALGLAVLAALVNGIIAAVYGWLLNALFAGIEAGDDLPAAVGDVSSLTVPLLLVGEIWYLTPLLWLGSVSLALLSRGTRAAMAAMVIATASLVAFALMLGTMPRWF